VTQGRKSSTKTGLAANKDGARQPSSKALKIREQSGGPYIVGLGASAGGLEALEAFFKAMPANSNAGFVVVSHLDPSHVSLMPELLQRYTSMPVVQIKDGMTVAPNHVYVIPPNRELSILHGKLELLEIVRTPGAHLPINNFFRSLAQDQGSKAIGIILSGTGSDGSNGLKEIKAELGMAMAQSEASAKYDGMPHSAMTTGVIDYILPPDQMPRRLIGYLKHAVLNTPADLGLHEGRIPDAMQKIFIILRSRTKHDFSLYKRNTICRRIERRMHVHQIDDIDDYVRYLQESANEADILFKEFLIGVTNFFRDPQAFESLGIALTDILKDKPEDYTVRVWVAGCSSGEEAYSIAMLLIERMDVLKRHISVQVFATDIDDEAITIARKGQYPASMVADMSNDRLRRFFVKEDSGGYRVKKSVRELLVFAPQNLIKDPPFTKLDLLCCRNLLIYLGPELQQKLLPVFHYSLRPQGILFLGSSESIGKFGEYFRPVDKKWKIFSSVPSLKGLKTPVIFPTLPPGEVKQEANISDTINHLEEISAFQMAETILQQSDAPPCVIINDAHNILYIHGRTGKFLEPAEGRVTVNVIDMARAGLKKELAEAIRKVSLHRQEVICKGLHVQVDGNRLATDLIVRPIMEPGAMRGMIMVVFDETSAKQNGQASAKKVAKDKPGRSAEELEEELHHTRESLQTTIEELETSNEELKSANEELQSTNEELQSTNEELETSKEELQSLNEESATVNVELQSRIDDLSNANDDMKNLLDSTDIATIFLDGNMCIRRFTPRIASILPLTTADTGRPVGHFSTSLVDADLSGDAKRVLDDLVIREREAVSNDGMVYLIRVRPYRTVANVIDGVVITFQDITERKKAEGILKQQARFAEGIVRTVREPLVVLNSALRVVTANPAFYTTFSVNEAETMGELVYELGNGQWNIPGLRKLFEDILPSNSSIEDFRVDHAFESIGQRSMLINASRIIEEEGLILLAIEDITTRQ